MDEKRERRNAKAREHYRVHRETVLAKRKTRRVSCPHCPFTFCGGWYLQEHIRRRHAAVDPLEQEASRGRTAELSLRDNGQVDVSAVAA